MFASAQGWTGWLVPLLQVVMIDVTLAGDNAVVVGLAVAGLPARDRTRAVAIGVGGAALVRVFLSLIAVRLLAVIGLTLAGGILLLWVCWKMARELRHAPAGGEGGGGKRKTLLGAIVQIAVADLSMSLDNVLAVAGAAREHLAVMVAGLAMSVLLMGVAAHALAALLQRQRWIAWVGLLIVLFVAGRMIRDGWADVARHAHLPARFAI